MSTTKLVSAVEDYITDLRKIRASGGGTGERSYYPPLTNLLNAVGSTLKPKVFCISELAQQGAGHPDIGLYAAKQVQKGKPRQGQIPECGVLEVKSADDDAWLTVGSEQVSKYWSKYRLVLVTNTRDFVLLGEDSAGQPTKLQSWPAGLKSTRARSMPGRRPCLGERPASSAATTRDAKRPMKLSWPGFTSRSVS